MFNEETTVEQMVLDTLCDGANLTMAAEAPTLYSDKPPGWRLMYADALPRQRTIPLSVQNERLGHP